MNKYKIYMIVCIITLMITITLTGTYAYFTWSSKENTTLTMTIGNLADVTFKGGPDINTTSLAPVFNYTDGEKTSLEITNKSTSETALYTISLNIASIAPELINESFKYKLVRLDSTGKVIENIDGSFLNTSNNTSITLTSDYLLNASVKYEFYLYIDGNLENNPNMMNKNFTGSIGITAEATTKPTLTNYIDYKYNNSSKEIVVNHNIDYIYASGVSLMNDGFGGTTSTYSRTSLTSSTGNIRYYGKNPNNYIYFNCDDYNNQTKDTCELWRIIGLFDGKVKLVRNESIGGLSWDQDKNDDSNKTSFDNNWRTSTLQKLLNDKYYAGTEKVIYYNHYLGKKATTLDFTKIGLKNDITRNMIEDGTWNIGGYESSNLYSNQFYQYEITSTWNGRISLITSSDYGYATDFKKCSKVLYNYNDLNCKENDWLVNGYGQWLLTKYTGNIENVYTVFPSQSGLAHTDSVYLANAVLMMEVHPSLFLTPNIEIFKGDGSSSNPYQLSAN